VAKDAVSIAELKELLEEKEKELSALEARRVELSSELEAVEEQIAVLRGEKKGRGRRRSTAKARRARPSGRGGRMTLKGALITILGSTRKALGAQELAEALSSVGYSSTSKNLTTMIGNVLSKEPEFRRVSRGKYRLDKRRVRKPAATKASSAEKSESEAPSSEQSKG